MENPVENPVEMYTFEAISDLETDIGLGPDQNIANEETDREDMDFEDIGAEDPCLKRGPPGVQSDVSALQQIGLGDSSKEREPLDEASDKHGLVHLEQFASETIETSPICGNKAPLVS